MKKPRKPLKRAPLKRGLGRRGKVKAAAMKALRLKYPGECQLEWFGSWDKYFCSGSIDYHHKILRSQGGQDVPENIVRLCRKHHHLAHLDFDVLERIRASGANLLNGETIS